MIITVLIGLLSAFAVIAADDDGCLEKRASGLIVFFAVLIGLGDKGVVLIPEGIQPLLLGALGGVMGVAACELASMNLFPWD